MNRREFTKGILATVTSFALMDSLFAFDAFASPVKPIADHWALSLQEYCSDLKKQSISPIEWQERVESLFDRIELEELLKFIDFKNLQKGFQYPDLGVATRPVKFPRLSGLPERTAFVKKIFGMKKGRSIIPHGHSNMASAHLILKGDLHLRHYEKIREEENHLVVKPSIDRIISVGDHSSISDEQDNVHWFIAQSEAAFTFDVIMLDLDGEHYDIHNLDIKEKVDLSNGMLRVPILDVETALKKYGKEMHH